MKIFRSTLFKLLLTSFCYVLSVGPLLAQAQWQQGDIMQYPAAVRFITTSGVGTVGAVPDEVSIDVTVKNWNKELRAAYAENDLLAKNISNLVGKYKLGNQDVQTSAINVTATYSDEGRSMYYAPAIKATGYNVERTITFLVKNVSLLPSVLSDAIDAGASSVHSIRFDTSKARKFKDEARALAVRAAKEKADAIASQLNAKVGKALIVKETASSLTRLSEAVSSNSRLVNEAVDSSSDSISGIASGHLNVSSSVSITFELTD